jgi:hypothetical protein
MLYTVIEPDRGGETLLDRLSRSRVRDQVRIVTLDGVKDLSDLHLADPDQFLTRWAAAKAAARSLAHLSAEKTARRRATLGPAVKALAERPCILDEFSQDLARSGVVGEARSAKLLFLVVTSRLREWPVAAKVPGPSSGGKSWLVERTLEFFPPAAYHALTAMSERALAYGEEDLQHRVLVLYEAAALSNDFGSYLLRSLLSERCVRYETVEKTKDGMRPRLIERPGPTGLILTTTAIRLHPENETRLLAIPITDTPEQTRAVMRATALKRPTIDVQRWRELHEWVASGPQDVSVPYASTLAETIPPVAVRLRRDFRLLLTLIETHALLHQATRLRDKEGWILASMDDYAAIRGLVVDLFGETLEASVPASVRDTVQAVAESAGAGNETSVSRVAKHLELDKSAVSRRVQAAIARGFLKNLETGRGRPARLVLGDPLPDDQQILPRAEDLFAD